MIIMDNISKKIKSKYVLKNVSYKFEGGKIYGIFGRNGSGKTMLLRALSGLIVPTQGSIQINGKQLHQNVSCPTSVGLIIENMQLLPQYNGYKNLNILSKIKKTASKEDISNALERVGLDPYSKLKVKKYSLGMKQRLNIAQAIFEKPEIILLDEPINAIDEKGVKLVHNILLEEKKRGAIIIIATHHKEDITPLCDYILKMSDGELID
ncbi:ATP-binding cassette domain-containing protein [Terrilactibacillus laevilacticus]|uniref:ATP-binding cassette domain-containing protein n=1 Tax=Terrilactibacillus laevilacticus TaxID=1380157 RepID=UPI001146C65B|nr:ABC transporter ATP-binding protein [Terrilactibacillus laevilacticus]